MQQLQYKQCKAGLAADAARAAVQLTTNSSCAVPYTKLIVAGMTDISSSLSTPEACSASQQSACLLAVLSQLDLQASQAVHSKTALTVSCKSWRTWSIFR
jgi:hypothetical protein